jgi:hypothetical protein
VERRGHRRASTGRWLALRPVDEPRKPDADAQAAAELAELEALAAALSAADVEGVPPVQGPQDWG